MKHAARRNPLASSTSFTSLALAAGVLAALALVLFTDPVTLLRKAAVAAAPMADKMGWSRAVDVVVYPGLKVNIDHKNTRIWGSQQCPKQSWNKGFDHCILIAPQTRQIQVFFHQDDHQASEIWTLQGDAPSASWRRPDGSVVLSDL